MCEIDSVVRSPWFILDCELIPASSLARQNARARRAESAAQSIGQSRQPGAQSGGQAVVRIGMLAPVCYHNYLGRAG